MDKDISEFPIQFVKGVGPQRAKLLARLDIKTVEDALYYLPCRYEDRRNLKKIFSLMPGKTETVAVKVVSGEIISRPGSRLKIFELILSDGTGMLRAKWFNQPYMKRLFRANQKVILNGVVKQNSYTRGGFEMDSPEYEFSDDSDQPIHTSRIVPVYRTTSGLSTKALRSIINSVLNAFECQIEDPMPQRILLKYCLPSLKESIFNSHFPDQATDIECLDKGSCDFIRRLAFDEFFKLELGIAILKNRETRKRGISFEPNGELVRRLLEQIPFELTGAQKKVYNDILQDMKRPYPMNRLIQGDVGCGKTVVALMAMLTAVECGYQAALMAPTEVLAGQHYLRMHRLAENLGLRICILSGSRKDRPVELISSGDINIVVGTHALIQEGVNFKKLGLAVIDEQHRFGVMQRASLRMKAQNPDVLVMTATPIPRTLSMTLYGDLDYSVIDEMPSGRSPVITRIFNNSQKHLIYNAISEEVKKGRQVYVVYPVIEESENSDLKSAIAGKTAIERLFPDFSIGLIHGKMKPADREAVMSSFAGREIDILVSTTVIEVGVDVPNATMMLIVHAERFGLSQLHQLRGRVGRGGDQSYCFLLGYAPYSEDAGRRLNIMVESSDGFRISEEDLGIRGPGEFLGTKQSGMPDLKIASLVRDSKLLELARKEAFNIVMEDPELKNLPRLRNSVEKFWEGKIEIFKTG